MSPSLDGVPVREGASEDAKMSSRTSDECKERVEYETLLTRSQACEQLSSLLKSLKSGDVYVQHGQQALELSVSEPVRFEFQAKRKGKDESVTLSFHWEREDEHDRVVISEEPPKRISRLADAAPGVDAQPRAKAPHYEKWTRERLYGRAKAMEIEGRSEMNKEALIGALRGRSSR